MGPFDGMVGKGLKPIAVQKQKVHVRTVPVKAGPVAVKREASAAAKSTPSSLSYPPRPVVSKDRSLGKRVKVPSGRGTSTEAKALIRQDKSSRAKRSSPAVSTPRLDSDESDEDEDEAAAATGARKRRKVEGDSGADTGRQIRDMRSSAELKEAELGMIHAADVATLGTDEHPNDEYVTFFRVLTGDEEDAPVVELQYPGGPVGERYQLVRGRADDDFKPLDEMIQVISAVAEHYLLPRQADKISDEASGLLQRLKRARLRGHRGEAGAQSKFTSAINEYSAYVTSLRKDGTFDQNLDNVHTVQLPLVETILQQIYARTVSPRIHTLRAYENGTDNVYGELLPKFCDTIFRETGLQSHHTFVDLGSGVGNVVLQAALQTGCASHGCEMMPNACDLAALQEREFAARCRLWGLSAGTVTLERGDFLTNPPTLSALQRADVVLINNQAFTPALNDALLMHFLDLPDGCRIVSLKPFRPPGHKITARNIASPVNLLRHLRQLDYFSGSVSWTDAPGSWYIQVKHSLAPVSAAAASDPTPEG